MNSIQVTFSSYTEQQIQEVLDYYNQNKPENSMELEKLNRAEGGFCIKLTPDQMERVRDFIFYDQYNPNFAIKQLRWTRKFLVPLSGYAEFDDAETALLLDAMKHVFGEEYVKMGLFKIGNW
jgi:hypothetical protein